MDGTRKTFKDIVNDEGVKPKSPFKEVAPPTRQPPSPRARAARESATASQKKTPPKEPEDLTKPWKKPGVQHNQMKNLRKGNVYPREECDLHGETIADAQDLLRGQIADCRAQGCPCMLVVCGRGLHSKDGRPILRPAVCKFLYDHSDVLACCEARTRDGGDGALYVLLK